MPDLKSQITELAHLMDEFGLEEAKLKGEDWLVEFSRTVPAASMPVAIQVEDAIDSSPKRSPRKPKESAPAGTPISSPMMGIFYSSPNPGSPNFVNEGDTITPGQVIGLIEAMKVFNEITASVGGTVLRVAAQSGQLVQPGEALIFVG